MRMPGSGMREEKGGFRRSLEALLLALALLGASGALAQQNGAGTPAFSETLWNLPDEEMLGFVRIPGGPFLMGSDPARDRMAFQNERWSATRRQGRPELQDYYIARYEVTVGQFRAFLEDSQYRLRDEMALSAPDDHPVAYVAWTDALAYARWLNRRLLSSPETPVKIRALLDEGWRVSLPDEAEWEKAARGTQGRIFPWGDRPVAGHANFMSAGTVPVGSTPCPDCPHGLFDMSGNVWEWTTSPSQPYPFNTEDDRSQPEAEALWIMRGGSFTDEINSLRAATRGAADPGVRRPFIGFRLALKRKPAG